jgi:hypothetical protein
MEGDEADVDDQVILSLKHFSNQNYEKLEWRFIMNKNILFLQKI